ncbi:hypothetical protein Gasu2_03370 [Galdieria sulphuraria]|uniref:Uncharacterized protein n=1 Tax=Galdieria sulphuraria TaxID=130081 RepID=M2Y081_GALSU|nr:uncharacterized protein Gasu_33050 [Galdieria sulphuraria]EME29298.1 hypothetical protein Gasu_33050 [Galdieria sulphuraria]GJD05893.1 hypothetical protein Gasu2_03370 [Galdieria sulphuraria]|eukprot:XP_005705818.1 hypothetical protein Gasu_33050 [Galdieria sulphuraria]
MSWEDNNCELFALRSSLEAQAGSLANLAVRLRTAEYNIEKQLCANKGLKSALVKLASREAVTRSQVYGALERIETDVADLRSERNSTYNIESGKNSENYYSKRSQYVCTECQALSRKLEAIETRLETLTQQLQLQSVQSKFKPTSELSMRENAKHNLNGEHVCSVTTEHAVEPLTRKVDKDASNFENNIRRFSQTEGTEENENVCSSTYILSILEAVTRQEDISPNEFYCQLNFYLKKIFLSTICGRNVSARLIFDLGRCFLRIESSKAFKKLESSKKKQLNLLLKDIFVHFDSIFSEMKKNLHKETKQDKASILPAETNDSDHCSTSTFEALCAEKQNDYPLQQIFDESGFFNAEDDFNPTQNRTAKFKDITQNKKVVNLFEEKENLKTIALDDSTDLEWKECFRSMNENPF